VFGTGVATNLHHRTDFTACGEPKRAGDGDLLMNTKESVLFRCPHCGARVRVSEHMLGEEIECANPDCGRPFRVEAPLAQAIMDDAGDDGPGPTYEVGDADRIVPNPEKELKIVHPSMWRRHPFQFLGLWALVAIGGITMFAGVVMGATWLGLASLTVGVIGLVIALAAGAVLAVWWLKVHFTMLIVSNKRTVFRHGIISRATSEVQHDDVRNLQLDQNAFERIMAVGDIAISSSGQDEMEIVARDIPHPDEVVALIRQMQ
jgi:hypothetical protein